MKYKVKVKWNPGDETILQYSDRIRRMSRWLTKQQWSNCLYDEEAMVFRFEHEKHYTLFLLKWS